MAEEKKPTEKLEEKKAGQPVKRPRKKNVRRPKDGVPSSRLNASSTE